MAAKPKTAARASLDARILWAKQEARRHGTTPLNVLARWGFTDGISEMVKAGDDCKRRDRRGDAPLDVAAKYQQVDAIRLLHGLGAPVNSRRTTSPLHTAARESGASSLTALIALGADVNAKDRHGMTPLHVLAHHSGDVACGRLLILAGADATIVDAFGRTAFDVAKQFGSSKLAVMLAAKQRIEPGADALAFAPLLALAKKRPKAIARHPLLRERDLRDIIAPLEAARLGPRQDLAGFVETLSEEGTDLYWETLAFALLFARAHGRGKTHTKQAPFVHGDLRLAGDQRITGTLVVTGDLTVDGVLRDSGVESHIIVGGNLTALAVDGSGDLAVGGNLDAAVLWGADNDCRWGVGGNASAALIVLDDHEFVVGGKVTAEFLVGRLLRASGTVRARHRFERADPSFPLEWVFSAIAADRHGR